MISFLNSRSWGGQAAACYVLETDPALYWQGQSHVGAAQRPTHSRLTCFYSCIVVSINTWLFL